MLIPIIKVIDMDSPQHEVHIVGTDKDDCLLVNPETGGLEYFNSRDGRGTGAFGGYEFANRSEDIEIYAKIKFVPQNKLRGIKE